MSQLAMAHGHPNGLRISPQNIPQPSHMQSSNGIPVSSAQAGLSMMPQSSVTMSPTNTLQQSPSHNLSIRSSSSPMSPDKKDLNVDITDERKDGNAVNMTISPQATDIRTNSIAALRIKAKEHLENINKNLTMV